ncbi:caspase, EACC1-associated type [Streptomyces sp. 1331.2]|uniref:caspase, EACC1-associated type n=1 Tax=Streptomyces sp. 1331.2 TaxID=1938835 RepID=UPI000BDD35C9|nr:AAA domain-containing protein [Streptomyces sp. 1331.2]SOB89032.1 Caspase domain-containing protein [Streptomyces sp. 1331.2]
MSRLVRRRALLIANENYDDGRFGRLPSTKADVWHLGQVLEHRSIGAFVSVKTVADLTADDMQYEISEFLESCDQDELALLYVSGHGTRLSARAGGEFHFVAKDTDHDRVAATAVGAGFVNERLESCWARQKVVMIDCCQSGGFAVGLRTTDQPSAPAAKSGADSPLRSHGVYVLSSSRVGEDSYGGSEAGGVIEPSAFTAEVVEALRTGKVSKSGTGEVSVGDLFDYVVRRMRAKGSAQIPVKSAHGVDDRMILASCPVGSAPRLTPLTRRITPESPSTEQTPKAATPGRSQPGWPELLAYYQQCVLSDQADTPLMSVYDHGTKYVCLTGSERLLSGELDEDDCTEVPQEAVELIEAAAAQDADLWAGYPVVLLNGPRNGKSWAAPKFAPLLVRRVEVVHHENSTRLKPYGPVMPHPRLAETWLGKEQAAELSETYQPTWHAGQHDRMAVDVRNLLMQEYELPCVHEPRPDHLADRIDVRTPGNGARNSAVLFLAPRDPTGPTKKLLADFKDITKKVPEVGRTALAALSPVQAERAESQATAPKPVRLVTPLPSNEAQSAVLRSAMTRRLTVATGPPGTGKSQLVANLVATALAAGERVLIASTNNQAVDEVWQRCERLSPGSVVRTGSSWGETDYRGIEDATLRKLLEVPEPFRNLRTAELEVDVATDRLSKLQKEFAQAAALERALRQSGEAREQHADRLGLPVGDLGELLATDDLERLSRKAAGLSRAWFLGERRRKKLLRRIGVESNGQPTSELCSALSDFATTEQGWRRGRERALALPNDAVLSEALDNVEAGVRSTSSVLLDSAVKTAARTGRQAIIKLLTTRDANGNDWPAVRSVLSAARGWAVTSLSARNFPPDAGLFDLVIVDEASQCSIPAVLPLLFRARRALIIGDAMQLPHITKIGPERESMIRRSSGLRSDWLERHQLAYRRHSAFHAAERAAGASLLLDEHFRCHPAIADVSNRLFYDGQLTVLTDVRSRPSLDRPAIVWSDVRTPATRPRSGGSWVNDGETEMAENFVRSLLRDLPAEATIGVVTPFKAHEEALQRRLGRTDPARVRIGTVHTFQGGERDVVVFSLVAGGGMHPGAVSWVDRQINLWNVAITRARSHLIVVGNADLWQQRGGVGTALFRAATAASPPGPSEHDGHGELIKRLYTRLSAPPGATVELDAVVNGHRADAVVRNGQDRIAVLLDPGHDDADDAARHLRLMLRRRQLLDVEGGRAAERVPAWRLFDMATRPDQQ